MLHTTVGQKTTQKSISSGCTCVAIPLVGFSVGKEGARIPGDIQLSMKNNKHV